MKKQEFEKRFRSLRFTLLSLVVILGLLMWLTWIYYSNPGVLTPDEPIIPSDEMVIAEASTNELVDGPHKALVVANCSGCHSLRLVTQNRASREGWKNMIRWMQKTQNLRDLGEYESKILDYLSENYAPATQGRRANLEVSEWYELEED